MKIRVILYLLLIVNKIILNKNITVTNITDTHVFFTVRDADGEEGAVASWELRVEGRLIDDDKRVDPSKTKRKFSSFFKVRNQLIPKKI